ncbi:MAG: 2-oxoglutarate dehydrogenase E1 component [Gammaproteobacteria bacterium RIFCSPHIGHO2_12_FULL_45_9]|nr:MAG: 2-oxoglutarate dehydrogenase E1 component [Gammaproteobacteria bacterium RIFCSPHIGHO2_12_FULL_45_9]
MIAAYRRLGHLKARLDPLADPRPAVPALTLLRYGLEGQLQQVFQTRGVLSVQEAPLSHIVDALEQIYSSTVGFEYTYISDETERTWLRHAIEVDWQAQSFSAIEQKEFLQQLVAADTLEKYLDMRYVGQKRFSIEGADALLPMLVDLAPHARACGIQEIKLGMAHRGRLNLLLNLLGYSPQALFKEFEGHKEYGSMSGDVKYHRGYARDVMTPAGPLHWVLAFNPSHLEFVNPVVMGTVRACQVKAGVEKPHDYALGVLIHGDAAFIGQGINQETLSMSQTRAYGIGGVLHIVANNQVGFTTSNPHDARSTVYCSDIAKMLEAPVFHVNGDDVESAIKAMRLALAYRQQFHKDVVIDLVCYRRHGHQEVDEPTATQPMMYQKIRAHATPKAIYAEQLVKKGVIAADDETKMTALYRACLEEGREVVPAYQGPKYRIPAEWLTYQGVVWTHAADTTVPLETLKQLGNQLVNVPAHFVLQRQVGAMMDARRQMMQGAQPLDWGAAELLAYASLVYQGTSVRLSGEDCRRGTFSHRHSTLMDQKTGEEWCGLKQVATAPARMEIYDSLLSEIGPLGFEYGYALTDPATLVLWEAQFGDFANVAQVIIDQFISSGGQKWNRLSGVTLLLPHGYEGQGPEHSSARLERYLQLCAEDNMQVCVPTTPAQIFHLLRRQVVRPYRRPLIVMTPKSLLRHKLAVSPLESLAKGRFEVVLPEIDALSPKEVTRVILCSGKVYYDLLSKRRELNDTKTAIVRIEQLYPFPYDALREAMAAYVNANTVIWCQEEPQNQGAWFISQHRLENCLLPGQTLSYAGREPSAAPAAGYAALHQKQQAALIAAALGLAE